MQTLTPLIASHLHTQPHCGGALLLTDDYPVAMTGTGQPNHQCRWLHECGSLDTTLDLPVATNIQPGMTKVNCKFMDFFVHERIFLHLDESGEV